MYIPWTPSGLSISPPSCSGCSSAKKERIVKSGLCFWIPPTLYHDLAHTIIIGKVLGYKFIYMVLQASLYHITFNTHYTAIWKWLCFVYMVNTILKHKSSCRIFASSWSQGPPHLRTAGGQFLTWCLTWWRNTCLPKLLCSLYSVTSFQFWT